MKTKLNKIIFLCGFTVSFLLILLLPTLVFADSAISKIEFSTSPQTIDVNKKSGEIIIEPWTETGVSTEGFGETTYFSFVSTSATGQFLGSSGTSFSDPSHSVMAKTALKRTFYYKDSTPGEYTLTITVTGNDSKKTWTASQNITVSDTASGRGGETATTTATTTPTENSNNNNSGTSSGGSSHYSYAPLSASADTPLFEVSAGRNRLSTVNNPIEFKAIVKERGSSHSNFRWSFGDGETKDGEYVAHSYKFPGDYVVVLNSQNGNESSVSRINVKIVNSEVEISAVQSEYVEIYNKSNLEVNLYNWILMDDSSKFVFPQDTIIQGGKKVSFSNETTKLKFQNGSVIKLIDPANKIENLALAANISVSGNNVRQLSIEEIKDRIEKISLQIKKLADSKQTPDSSNFLAYNQGNAVPEVTQDVDGGGNIVGASTTQIANIYEAVRPKSAFQRSWGFVRNLFDPN